MWKVSKAFSVSHRCFKAGGHQRKLCILSTVSRLFGQVFDLVSNLVDKTLERFANDSRRSRRPVRTLLFQCSVCSHGGHRECYEQFYMQQPMEEIPSTFMPLELSHTPGKGSPLGGSGSDIDIAFTNSESETSPTHDPWTKKLMGHRCATGCGHFCWVVNETRNL
jgi:hypothetical protein